MDDLRRLIEQAVWTEGETVGTYERQGAEDIRVRANPFRPGVPREASIEQLRRRS